MPPLLVVGLGPWALGLVRVGHSHCVQAHPVSHAHATRNTHTHACARLALAWALGLVRVGRSRCLQAHPVSHAHATRAHTRMRTPSTCVPHPSPSCTGSSCDCCGGCSQATPLLLLLPLPPSPIDIFRRWSGRGVQPPVLLQPLRRPAHPQPLPHPVRSTLPRPWGLGVPARTRAQVGVPILTLPDVCVPLPSRVWGAVHELSPISLHDNAHRPHPLTLPRAFEKPNRSSFTFTPLHPQLHFSTSG